MLKLITIFVSICGVYSYFTLPGKCPENVHLQEGFRLNEFYGKWYQTHHYSSDGQHNSNCSTLELITKPSGVYLNQSRVDRGLFHRYSIAKVNIPMQPSELEDAAKLGVIFEFENAPRRLKTRKYPFHVLATNNFYATVYTCQYSPLINKHFIYVWVLSRNPTLNEVSKALAVKPLQQIGVDPKNIIKDDRSKCTPKYYEDISVEPMTFRFPVPI